MRKLFPDAMLNRQTRCANDFDSATRTVIIHGKNPPVRPTLETDTPTPGSMTRRSSLDRRGGVLRAKFPTGLSHCPRSLNEIAVSKVASSLVSL